MSNRRKASSTQDSEVFLSPATNVKRTRPKRAGLASAVDHENVTNPPAQVSRTNLKHNRRSPKKGKTLSSDEREDDKTETSEDIWERLGDRFKQVDDVELDLLEVAYNPLVGSNPVPASTMTMKNPQQGSVVEVYGLPVQSNGQFPMKSPIKRVENKNMIQRGLHSSGLATGNGLTLNTDDVSSQTASSDSLPDSSTFHDGAPIANNNDFEIPSSTDSLRVSQSGTTASNGRLTDRSSTALSSNQMDIETATYESIGSTTRRRTKTTGGDLSGIIFELMVKPKTDSLIEDDELISGPPSTPKRVNGNTQRRTPKSSSHKKDTRSPQATNVRSELNNEITPRRSRRLSHGTPQE